MGSTKPKRPLNSVWIHGRALKRTGSETSPPVEPIVRGDRGNGGLQNTRQKHRHDRHNIRQSARDCAFCGAGGTAFTGGTTGAAVAGATGGETGALAAGAGAASGAAAAASGFDVSCTFFGTPCSNSFIKIPLHFILHLYKCKYSITYLQ